MLADLKLILSRRANRKELESVCTAKSGPEAKNISPNCFPQETVAYEYIDYLRHKPIDNITIPYDSRTKGMTYAGEFS